MAAREHIGSALPGVTVQVEEGLLRFFAKAIGETNPLYLDQPFARAQGHRGLLVPPTYLFCLEMHGQSEPLSWLKDIGVDLLHILHGGQSFEYKEMAYAGDTLMFTGTITDIYEKKGGALTFIVKETMVRNQFGSRVAALKTTIVVRP